VIAAHSVNATPNPKLPYDTMKDFTYVSLMSSAPLIIIANKALPAIEIPVSLHPPRIECQFRIPSEFAQHSSLVIRQQNISLHRATRSLLRS
jgi:hypothetical protein